LGNRVGVIPTEHRNYDAATSLSLTALEGYKETWDIGDPYTLACVSALALLLNEGEDLEQSEILYRLLLEESEKVFGREDPQTLLLTIKLVLTLFGQGRYAEEEATRMWLLKVDEKVLGKGHRETLRNLCTDHSALFWSSFVHASANLTSCSTRKSRMLGAPYCAPTFLSATTTAAVLATTARAFATESPKISDPLFRARDVTRVVTNRRESCAILVYPDL
jgi:hypothetical protein